MEQHEMMNEAARITGIILFQDIPRNTRQCFVMIIYDTKESTFGKFRNTMVLNIPVFHAYGNGEFFGMSKAIDAGLSFDDHDQAVKCIESRTELREKMWLGGVEMYVVPLCNPVRHIGDYPFFQMDMYDVKNGRNFIKYLNTVEEMVHRKGGLIVAGTTQAGRWRGIRRPYFILLHQWVTVEQLEAYNNEVSPILRDAGAACSSRVIFEMTTGNVRCFQ
ncbi:unnamed protein product [Schistocephalus solidus]|uniref:DUF1330 domain-containing protein n=1 Tax=Schistocephalus solidus TaxID=70667 RepID=A0A183S8K3_SCHSO|nr:unnamed protein product [Schistocephalus solidus]